MGKIPKYLYFPGKFHYQNKELEGHEDIPSFPFSAVLRRYRLESASSIVVQPLIFAILALQLMPLILTETERKTIHIMAKLPIALIFTTSSIASPLFLPFVSFSEFPSLISHSHLLTLPFIASIR